MSRKHFPKSPSSAARRLACPGSVHLPQEPDTGSAAANEGTLAHGLAEEILTRCLDGDGPPALDDYEPALVVAVTKYVNYVLGKMRPESDVLVEKTFVSKVVPDLGGTPDGVIIHADNTAEIVDFKFGMNPVFAERNPQLLDYAGLVLEQYPQVKYFTLTIVQPRARDTPDAWECKVSDVLGFRELEKKAGLSDELNAGPHCRYCPAKANCPDHARVALDVFKDPPTADDPERLRKLYDLTPSLKSLLEAIPGKMIGAVRQGHKFDGLKVVQTLTTRKWSHDEKTTLKKLANRKLGKRTVTVQKLLTPTQLEKVVGKEKVAGLWTREQKGFAIVRETDRRDEHIFESVNDQFAPPSCGGLL